jgi:flagellar capping protein FliD
VDCVFIDGDHTYTGVKEDISLWTPKIKDGGYYIFDDISYSFPGTVKAVDEFVDNHNLTIRQLNRHNNYYVQKPTKFTLPASYFP